MNFKRFFSSITQIGISNIIALCCNVLLSLFIPKILGTDDYAFYKIFTLYISYVSLLHLGLVDGIVLKYGGQNHESVDRNEINSICTLFGLIEFTICLLILFGGIIIFDSQYYFILISVVLNIFVVNLTSFFQLYSQAVKRFKELAFRNIVNAILQVLFLLILFLAYKYGDSLYVNYKLCIVLNILTKIVLLIWYVATYKDISIPHAFNWHLTRIKVINLMRIGLPITWAAMISNLIIVFDRQFVSLFFNKAVFATYSFAYTLFGLIVSTIATVATVLYPMIKENKDKKQVYAMFPMLVASVQILVAGALLLYMPLKLFVGYFIPNFVSSLTYFVIIYPGAVISSVVSIVILTYFKYAEKGDVYFKLTIVTLCVAVFTNVIGYLIFKKAEAIAIASIITLLFQYITTNLYLKKYICIEWKKNALYLLLILIAFYFSVFLFNNFLGFFFYLFTYLILSTLMFGKQIIHLFRKLRSKGAVK